VINLGGTGHGFMVAFASGLMGGQISLLPSARGSDDRKALKRRHPEACLVSEHPIDGEEGFAIAPFLEDRSPRPFAIPEIDSRLVAATLFTSGSTGEPTAHHKTWGRLCRGPSMLATAPGWESDPALPIVGRVPPPPPCRCDVVKCGCVRRPRLPQTGRTRRRRPVAGARNLRLGAVAVLAAAVLPLRLSVRGGADHHRDRGLWPRIPATPAGRAGGVAGSWQPRAFQVGQLAAGQRAGGRTRARGQDRI